MKIVQVLLLCCFICQFSFSQSIEITPENDGGRINLKTALGGLPTISSLKSSGTSSNPEAVLSGYALMAIYAGGYNGSFYQVGTAKILISATENFATQANGTKITFYTTSNGGVPYYGDLRRMVIDHNGRVGIGIGAIENSPAAKLDVDGNVKFGTNGTVIQEFIKAKVTFPEATVPANGCSSTFAVISNAHVNSTVYVSPEGAMESGLLIAYARVSSANNVGIRICNVSNSQVVQPSIDYFVTIIH